MLTLFLYGPRMATASVQKSGESMLGELHTYVKLLLLRRGRQYGDKLSYEELDGVEALDNLGNDEESFKNVPLGNLDEDSVRRAFLDRLSEVVSSMKGGRHVVASSMFYWPDKVKVFIAINSGFTQGNRLSKLLDTLSTALRDIAIRPSKL
jgi:hypothetical protein